MTELIAEPSQAKPYNPVDIKQVIPLLQKGYTQAEIADELGCSLNTLKAEIRRHKCYKGTVFANKPTDDGLSKASAELKSVLSVELTAQAQALQTSKVSYDELFNSRTGQGRTSLVKSLIEAGKALYGWGDSVLSSFGLVLLESPQSMLATDVQAQVVSTAQDSPVQVSTDPSPSAATSTTVESSPVQS